MGLVAGHAGVEVGGPEVEAVVSEGVGEEVVDSEGLAEQFLVGMALALTKAKGMRSFPCLSKWYSTCVA